MAIQEQPALADRVYALLGELDAAEVGSDTELAAIGFDSLAAAELAAAVQRELGVDLVDQRMAGLRTAREVGRGFIMSIADAGGSS